MEIIGHYINGKSVAGSGNRVGDVYNPALGKVIRQVSFAETKDADTAINAANDVF
ncbi:MAG: methylmalonate-semialdehyde dehydrogenase (CoA acylating), partial [Actinobacteria bacterium]|nr:methylmalonate-semialdehyde dehydrogenase (CoA acylating) [Actinomycetota bacterium]